MANNGAGASDIKAKLWPFAVKCEANCSMLNETIFLFAAILWYLFLRKRSNRHTNFTQLSMTEDSVLENGAKQARRCESPFFPHLLWLAITGEMTSKCGKKETMDFDYP